MKYVYPTDKLSSGSSLGNLTTFVQLEPETNICGVWSSLNNSFYLGSLSINILQNKRAIPPVQTVFQPFSQETTYSAGDLEITKRVEIPYSDGNEPHPEDFSSVFAEVEVTNESESPAELIIILDFHFPAVASPLFTKKPPVEETKKIYRVTYRSGLLTAREIAGGKKIVAQFSHTASSYAMDDGTAQMQFNFSIRPAENKVLRIVLHLDPADSVESLASRAALLKSNSMAVPESKVRDLLDQTEFLTPSSTINRGIFWAKVNTLRVQHKFRSGFGFTNDPPQDIVVVRDLAWYMMGCDYFVPDFSRRLAGLAGEHCYHPDGKLTEFIHAGEETPELHDYKLNINDDTPLFILALRHHANLSDDPDFAMRAFGLAKPAADYILSQLEGGLIYSTAAGTHVEGIASWRNIIPDYNLSGFVTEINAECCEALRAAADLADTVGESKLSKRYRHEARRLEENILSKLLDRKSGLFFLNIDQKGTPHADVTGDLVFPALFGVGDRKVRLSAVNKILSEDLWTQYGARTVAKTDPTYDPGFGMNLMGGVWPNLSAWFAMAAREFYPDIVAEAMEKIYSISEVESPSECGNVVPGEFPERLDGDSFRSTGMAMSPWMPPTYLWLGVEGLLGLTIENGHIRIEPSLPQGWDFICAFDIPVKGKKLSVVVNHGILYTNQDIRSELPTRIGTFSHIHRSDGLRLFKFRDGIGSKAFAFSFNGYEGNVSIQLNEHSHDIRLELETGEMQEIRID